MVFDEIGCSPKLIKRHVTIVAETWFAYIS